MSKDEDDPRLNFTSWIEWQRTLQRTVTIGHSYDSRILTDLLQYADSVRFDNPPSTQFQAFSSEDIATQKVVLSPAKTKQAKKKVPKKLPLIKSPCKKDGDIRTLFSTATKSTKNYTKFINDLGISKADKIPTQVINVLVDLCVENTNVTKTCYICLTVCNCKIIQNKKLNENVPSIFLPSDRPPNLPCIDWIDSMTKETFLNYANENAVVEYWEDLDTNVDYNYVESNNINNNSKNFDIELDFESLSEQNSPILAQSQRRRSSPILGQSQRKKCSPVLRDLIDKNDLPISKETQDKKDLQLVEENQNKNNLPMSERIQSEDDSNLFEEIHGKENSLKETRDKKQNTKIEKNFDIGDIDDIFADSGSEGDENIQKSKNEDSKPKEVLGYFQLDSIEDIFASSDEEVPELKSDNKSSNVENKVATSQIAIKSSSNDPVCPLSPSILSGRPIKTAETTSPILSSQARKVTTKVSPLQFQSSTPINIQNSFPKNTIDNLFQVPELKNAPNRSTLSNSDLKNISDKSMLTITQLVDLINKTPNQSSILQKITLSNESKNEDNGDRVQERTSSPILLTQRDREKSINTSRARKQNVKPYTSTNESIVIPDSDSEDSTELYDLENQKNTLNKGTLHDEDDLSIILTQNVKDIIDVDFNQNKGSSRCQEDSEKLEENIINLDSDSDDFIEKPDVKKNEMPNNGNVSCKRKFNDEEGNSASPYFAKKLKLNDNGSKKLSLQKKILAALTSNKFNNEPFNTNKDVDANFLLHSPTSPMLAHKENKSPVLPKSPKNDNEKHSKLDMLQKYRRDSKYSVNKIFKDCTNTSTPSLLSRRKITFSDSDDDFVSNDPQKKENQKVKKVNGGSVNGFANHKTRKKKNKANEFLDLEAELSDDGNCESGDELSDESVGSIIDFICDENDTHDQVDMHALYLKSIKSPVKGVFKIPQLTDKYKKADILSQSYVEYDNYEMDSFCVDSHIGLTQVNEVSELELAEMVLEQKRRNKKKSRGIPKLTQADDSPIVKKKSKVVNRISSDSDDSS